MDQNFLPREIVSELDRYVIGQTEAKRAIAIALRNRWRRQQLDARLRNEIIPKNILMIGPTGVGKTEIARRVAKLTKAPFIKVEATKFTEIGYVGRDVEQIIRDLVDVARKLVVDQHKQRIKNQAEQKAEEKILDALVGNHATAETRESFRKKLHSGEIDDKEIEVSLPENAPNPLASFQLPHSPGMQMDVLNLSEIFDKLGNKSTKKRSMKVQDALKPLIALASDELLNQEQITSEAVELAAEEGIVFIDEIDKIATQETRNTGNVSREGVQRDLLPLIEGTSVTTKYGSINTDHILFITSGAFHVSKPSDLLPELQGRLPIRVELNALTREDFKKILTQTEFSLLKQYTALIKTEGVDLHFTEDGIDTIADIAVGLNANIENIGARRLHAVLERVLDEVSFRAAEKSGETVSIDKAYVEERLGSLAKNLDLSRFIL